MSPVTQENLYLLLPSKVSWLAQMMCEERKISTLDAIRCIYSSEVYKNLEKEDTKWWHQGPVALYEMI